MNLHLWHNKGALAPVAAPRGVNDLANVRAAPGGFHRIFLPHICFILLCTFFVSFYNTILNIHCANARPDFRKLILLTI